ncbi:MAG: peptide-methionine (S)-S-oxide reductase MsrA [Candidatus Omnitrophica bacterium]|nr:peptide-methionine (S)-S-oxide reductase MsrA [Candidatus Omnitrophota bacterium]
MKRILFIMVFLFLGGLMPGRDHASSGELKKAIFAGGCFWCMQPPFDQIPGVVETTVGYTGGRNPNPTYEEVSRGDSGHVEAIEVTYDPAATDFNQLLSIFWQTIDPTDTGGQFADQGTQYKSAIFYMDEGQKNLAEASKNILAASGRFKKPIATQILPAQPFYSAEEYHQKYYKKNVLHYNLYKKGSGREEFLKRTWEK